MIFKSSEQPNPHILITQNPQILRTHKSSNPHKAKSSDPPNSIIFKSSEHQKPQILKCSAHYYPQILITPKSANAQNSKMFKF